MEIKRIISNLERFGKFNRSRDDEDLQEDIKGHSAWKSMLGIWKMMTMLIKINTEIQEDGSAVF